MMTRVVLLLAVLALAVRLWWVGPPARPVYLARHRAAYNPWRQLGTTRPPLALVVAHVWAYDE